MESCGIVLFVLLVLGVLLIISLPIAGFILLDREKTQEKERRQREHAEIMARQEPVPEYVHSVKELLGFWSSVQDLFPYLPPLSYKEELPPFIEEAIFKTLYLRNCYGRHAAWDIPVPEIPEKLRRRHLYVVGKTGSGKSTCLEGLICQDLARDVGVCVISPEGEFFAQRLLHWIPDDRLKDLIYFAPGRAENRVTFNPLSLEAGDDAIQAADDLFTILRRSFGEDSLGPRMRPLLQNSLAAVIGRPEATLASVRNLLEDADYRKSVVSEAHPYVKSFWEVTFPKYAKGAAIPIINRLDRFLRAPKIRRALCAEGASISIRSALAEGKILFLDLSGLTEDQRFLIGETVLSKFQLELMRRERGSEKRKPCYLYCDEFQSFAGASPVLWRELLARGRKYGLAVTLANQYPAQLPTAVRSEIFENVLSFISFALGSGGAKLVRQELLKRDSEGELQPVAVSDLLDLRIGQAFVSLGGGRAFKARMSPPLPVDESRGPKALAAMNETLELPLASEEPESEPAVIGPEPEEPPEQEELADPEPREPVPGTIEGEEAPALPRGRGGSEHRYMQAMIQEWGQDLGFIAQLETGLATGGFADLLLTKDDRRIGVEIAVSSTAVHEVANVKKCLAAGCTEILVVSARVRLLTEIRKRVEQAGIEENIHYLIPDAVYDHLAGTKTQEAPPEPEDEMIGGYRVRVKYVEGSALSEQARRRMMAELLKKVGQDSSA